MKMHGFFAVILLFCLSTPSFAAGRDLADVYLDAGSDPQLTAQEKQALKLVDRWAAGPQTIAPISTGPDGAVQFVFGAVPEMGVQNNAGNLELFAEFMNRQGDHIVLPVAVYYDDFAETRVPETGKHIADIIRQGFFRNHDGSLLAQMMIRMRAVPGGHGNGAAGFQRNLLAQPCVQIGVFAERCAGAVVFA